MKTYRSPMEKILDQQEMDTIITNPKQPVRTFFRKIRYILSVWSDKLRKTIPRLSHPHLDQAPAGLCEKISTSSQPARSSSTRAGRKSNAACAR